MCGIAGFIDPSRRPDSDWLAARAREMAGGIRHRGPDDEGVWTDAAHGVAFGHRRLSIIDVTREGHQPMSSADGRYVLVFNGEIYNHRAIRAQLERDGTAGAWRGHSDTEVMLAAFAAFGVRRSLELLNGMFAFAVWDRATRTLTLARDRLGEKPLYHGWLGGTFVFGSELKALRAHPAWNGCIDARALRLLLRFGYVPAPYSIHAGIRKLQPGSWLELAGDGAAAGREVMGRYWSARDAAERGTRDPLVIDDAGAEQALDALLRDAVGLRMEADVPLGAFLSGGVDSSTVVAMMQLQSAAPVRTFSIGFREAAYDEAVQARAVAAHLGTAHTELYVTPADALAVIPLLPSLYDEPFGDSSQIPTYLVSRLAREHVTVALSGDGGDELFGGYNRHVWGERIWRRARRLPLGGRALVARGMRRLPTERWDALLGPVTRAMPRSGGVRRVGESMHKLAGVLASATPRDVYRSLVTHWDDPVPVLDEEARALTVAEAAIACGDDVDLDLLTAQMMYLDLVSYLPDDILVKVDRASMGVSLEARVPLLDHRVVELAWRLPPRLKIRNGVGKWLLRRVLQRYVPPALVERPKTGFGIPLGEWLRGPLRDWAESLLDERRLREDGHLDAGPIRERWRQHLSRTRDWSPQLWDVLMFQAWLADQA